MPNYCENRLFVTPNTQENLEKFLLAASAMKDGEHQFFDTFLPTPEEMLKGSGWFDWRINNWGTKWDACELHSADDNIGKTPNQQLYVSFETAWSPPIQFYQHLESLGFTVYAQYFEPGCAFIGTYTNGKECSYELSPESIKTQPVMDLLDEFGQLEEYQEQYAEDEENFQEIYPGAEVFWNDPDEGLTSGYYKVVEIIDEDGEIHDDTIIRLVSSSGSEVEVFFHELTLPNQNGVLPCVTTS